MKKLLCIICLLAAVLFVDTASACSYGRCGGYYGRPSYSRSYYGRSYGRHYSRSYGHHYGFRGYGRHYGYRGYRSYGHRYGYRGYRGGRRYAYNYRRW